MDTRRFVGRLAVATLALLLGLTGAAGAGRPVGDEAFVIADQNVDTVYPSVAYNSSSQEYLVVWQNDRPVNDDLYAQRVSPAGKNLGGWFSVEAGSGAARRTPDVAYNPIGNEYLVVWEQETPAGGTTSIRGQRVRGNGLLLGGEFVISVTPALRTHQRPKVAYAETSRRYLVVWESHVQGSPADDVVGQAINDNGTLAGPMLVLAQGGWSASHGEPDLAYNLTRNQFLVAWTQTAGTTDIVARRVSGDGNMLSPASVLIDGLGVACTAPAVAAIPRPAGEGRYLVAWQAEASSSDHDIWARLVGGDGSPLGPDMPITLLTQNEFQPAVGANEQSESFLVAWILADMSLYQPVAREVGMDGRVWLEGPVLGRVFAQHPAAAGGPLGDILVVFDGQTMVGNLDIHGRLWGDRVYLPMVVRNQ